MLLNLAVLMCFYAIAAEYNGPLEAADAHIDDDRYDMVELGPAGQPKLDLSDQLRRCSNPSTNATRLSSANVLLCNRRQEDSVLMCFYTIAFKYNGPLEAAHRFGSFSY